MGVEPKQAGTGLRRAAHPFRSAVLRGMGILAPPLLTIVIFLWVGNTLQEYLLQPVSTGTRDTLVWFLKDVRKDIPGAKPGQPVVVDGTAYYRLGTNGPFIPLHVYELVSENPGNESLPPTANAYYQRYVRLKYMQPYLMVPFFLAVFVLILYLLGKFMAAGMGRVFYNTFEQAIHRVPLVRNVYSSVKQVSDFFFTEREVEYTRVVAVEYPRKGIWSLGFVTGESFRDIRAAVNEPVLSVLMATSPMPMTGFTITVRKSETIDLDITVEQAFQFIISCGVVVPPHQLQQMQREPQAPLPQNLLASEALPPSASGRQSVTGSGAK
jgi:uncharacterized membrane protein